MTTTPEPESASDALDPDSDLLRFAQHAQLGDAHHDAGRAEFLEYRIGDALGEALDQAETLCCEEGANVLHHDAVVDRVPDLPRLEHLAVGRKGDFQIYFYGLGGDLFMAIQPDPG